MTQSGPICEKKVFLPPSHLNKTSILRWEGGIKSSNFQIFKTHLILSEIYRRIRISTFYNMKSNRWISISLILTVPSWTKYFAYFPLLTVILKTTTTSDVKPIYNPGQNIWIKQLILYFSKKNMSSGGAPGR